MSTSSFIDEFLVPFQPSPSPPKSTFDERLQLNVLEDGRPLVDAVSVGSTITMTRADGETDDADPEEARPSDVAAFLGTMTRTAAQGESADEDQ